jgi:hypothetical protein
MLMMRKPKNPEFEPLHPKNVLFASLLHGISCLLNFFFFLTTFWPHFWLQIFMKLVYLLDHILAKSVDFDCNHILEIPMSILDSQKY